MSRRLGIQPASRTPDLRRYVGVCMTCHHWQIDVRAGAISDLGGANDALIAVAQAQADHVGASATPADDICPGAGGRVNFEGQWVDAPLMESGQPASGTLEFHPLPGWWTSW